MAHDLLFLNVPSFTAEVHQTPCVPLKLPPAAYVFDRSGCFSLQVRLVFLKASLTNQNRSLQWPADCAILEYICSGLGLRLAPGGAGGACAGALHTGCREGAGHQWE